MLEQSNSAILLLTILLLIVTYVGLYDGRPTTCDPQILYLPNLRVVLQTGLTVHRSLCRHIAYLLVTLSVSCMVEPAMSMDVNGSVTARAC